MTERDACIALNLISGIGHVKQQALRKAFGSYAAIFEQSKESLQQVNGISERLAALICLPSLRKDLAQELQIAESGGVTILTIADSDYPEQLKNIDDPPICLYIRGELSEGIFDKTLAIVGTRRMTHYGRKVARHLSESAGYAGWTVVSGLAFGIDFTAHKAIVDIKKRTIAVLASGLARVHPQEHIPLAKEILQNGGLLISELPMNTPATRQTYPRRNRIISGLSQGVLLIEAQVRSGAMITANLALEQNRLLFAVPGEIDNPQAMGCNKLIKDGAKLVERFEDILEEFEFMEGCVHDYDANTPVEIDVSGTSRTPEPKKLSQTFSDKEQKIIDALQAGSATIDQIAIKTELPVGKLLGLLMQLEMKKVVTQEPGRKFKLIIGN